MADTKSKIPPQFTFSQSSLQDYADCPRRFQLRYLDKLIYPAAETEPALENERHLLEGQLFHRLAQQFILGIPIDKLNPLANFFWQLNQNGLIAISWMILINFL